MYGKLCLYFAAFSVNLAALIVTFWLYGWGPAYAWVYSLSSVPIFLTIAAICWESLSTREYRFRAIALGFILAIVIGRLTYAGLARTASAYDGIMLIEGVLLVWAGTVLGFAASYSRRADIALTLAILWLVQALFSFGFVLHWDWPSWTAANWYLPEVICLAGFSLIGWRLRAGVQPKQLATLLL